MVTLRQLRAERNWTQKHLSERSGVDIKLISRMENGHPVLRHYIEQVLAVYHVSEKQVSGLVFSRTVGHKHNPDWTRGSIAPRRLDVPYSRG